MSQTPEQKLDKEIMIWCGQHDMLCFHANVGKIIYRDERTGERRYFDTGLPVGFPDLLILTNDGKTVFCETKIHPRKPTPEQVKTINLFKSRGFAAFVSYSLEEFIESLKEFKIYE